MLKRVETDDYFDCDFDSYFWSKVPKMVVLIGVSGRVLFVI